VTVGEEDHGILGRVVGTEVGRLGGAPLLLLESHLAILEEGEEEGVGDGLVDHVGEEVGEP